MNTNLQNTIKEETLKLPKEIREVVSSFDWVKISEEIAKRYSLNADQVDQFQLETFLVLMGIVDEDDYLLNVLENTELNKEISTQITNEALEKIFTPIMEKVRENIKKDFKNRKTDFQQEINFILSGGDYSVFLNQNSNPLLDKEGAGGGNSFITTSPKGTPPQQGGEIKSNLEEIKSKFTI